MNPRGWMLSPGKTLHPVYILNSSAHHDSRSQNCPPYLSRYPTSSPAPSPYETYPHTPQIYENSMSGMSHQNGVPSQLVSPISGYQHSYSTPVLPHQIPPRTTLVATTPQYIVQPPLAHVSIGSAGTMEDSCGIAELKETIEKVNSELDQLRTKISELNAKVREQEECLSTAQTEMSNLRKEHAQAQTEMNNLREENAQTKTEMSNLQEENAQAQTEMSNLREENAQLASSLKEVQDCQGCAEDKNKKLEQLLREKETELIRVQGCQGRAGDRMQKLEQQLREKETELIKVQGCQGRAGDRIQKLEQQLREKETELIKVQGCQGRAGDRIQKLEQQLREKETELIKVSIGSLGTMADSCCFAELKETIEKMNAELIQSHTKISEVREQEECLSAAQKEMSKLQEENAQLPTDLKEVNEANDDALDINSLPNEIILKIFSYLTQNQLGQIARVCRIWNALTKSPVLWRKVNVKFFLSVREKNTVAKSFINGLPSCVTFIRLDFSKLEDLDFEELCVKLHQNCPRLEELILAHCGISNILPEVLNFCTEFLQCVKKLVFDECAFYDYSKTVELNYNSKIEIFDLYGFDISHFNKTQFSKLLYLKELRLNFTDVDDTWFVDDISFLSQLLVLDLGWTLITASTFLAIQTHGHNLKELYLCYCSVKDHHLNFTDSAFPHLKTICLGLTPVTCNGAVSLIQSCPPLENIYVIERVSESFAAHSFVLANRCKSEIVKAIDWDHYHNLDYAHN